MKTPWSLELGKYGFRVQQQFPITVQYEGQTVGEYFADIVVNNRVIRELKAIETTTRGHEVQPVNYLTATGIDTGFTYKLWGTCNDS